MRWCLFTICCFLKVLSNADQDRMEESESHVTYIQVELEESRRFKVL